MNREETMKTIHHLKNQIKNGWSVLIWVMVVVFLLSGCVDKKPKVYQVGIICGADFFLPVIDGFRSKMTELGFVEGKNIYYDVQAFNTNPVRERQAVEKFVSDKVDLIFSVPTEASVAAQTAIRGTDIPLVFAYAGLEGTDLVDSVRKPGRNTTGLRFPGPETINKRLELLLQFAPWIKRVWIGYDKNYPNAVPTLNTLRPLSVAKGVTLVEVPAGTIKEIEADLAQRSKQADLGLDAIILMPDTFNHSPAGWGVIRTFAAEHQIPICGSFLYTVKQGALFGNANDLFIVGELTAPLVKKVLNGMQAGSIPVVTPVQQLIINYKVAQEMELTVPESLLNMATQIIR